MDKIDEETKALEDSIRKMDEEHELAKRKLAGISSRQEKSRNSFVNQSSGSVAQLNTQRDNPFGGSRSFLLEDHDLHSRSLIDIRTKNKHPRGKSSEKKHSQSKKKRPQSSRLKRPQINQNAVHKPIVEGEIMMRISVTITEDTTITVNVYKDDTAFSVADRCLSQHLAKLKVSQHQYTESIIYINFRRS